MKLFEKKFKVRVKHFVNQYYTVQYAHYRIFPVWHTLCFWFDQGVDAGTETWSSKLFLYEEAEVFARKLTNYEAVKNWYKPEVDKKDNFYKRRANYYKERIPYHTKNIS